MLPVEPLVLLGSAAFGGIMQMWRQKAKDLAEERMFRLSQQQANDESADKADKRGGESANVVKRTIALVVLAAATASVWAPLMGMAFDKSVAVVFGYMEFHPGFLFFTEDRDVLVWKEVKSGMIDNPVYTIVITPSLTESFMTILGFYFGFSSTKR